MPEPAEMSIDELQQLAYRAGLGMSREEVEAIKPVYDMYAAYARMCHEVEFGATEMVVEFHPDWPEE